MNYTYPNNRDYILTEYRALKSAKGWYVGRMGMGRGRYWEPFSRDSGYFVTKDNAELRIRDYIFADCEGEEEYRAARAYLNHDMTDNRMTDMLREI